VGVNRIDEIEAIAQQRLYLAILTNMGLRAAVSHVPIAQWLAAIQEVALQNPKLDDALRDRLVRAIAELNAVAECLEE